MGSEDDRIAKEAFARRASEKRAAAEAARPQRPQVQGLVAGVGGDPALRIALVRAGVIKYEDIVMAEEELRARAGQGGGVVFAEVGGEGNQAGGNGSHGLGVSVDPGGAEQGPGPGDRSGP